MNIASNATSGVHTKIGIINLFEMNEYMSKIGVSHRKGKFEISVIYRANANPFIACTLHKQKEWMRWQRLQHS